MSDTPKQEDSFAERRVGGGNGGDENVATETPQAPSPPPYRQLAATGTNGPVRPNAGGNSEFDIGDIVPDIDDEAFTGAGDSDTTAAAESAATSISASGPSAAAAAAGHVAVVPPRKTIVKPRLPPMMMRREVQVCNIFLAVLCFAIGPGLIVVSSMLAASAAYLAPHATTVLAAVSGIFLPVGVVFVVVPVYFLFFHGGATIGGATNVNNFLYQVLPTPWNGGADYDKKHEDEINNGNVKQTTSDPAEDAKDAIPDYHPLKRSCAQQCVSFTLRFLVVLVVILALVAGIFAIAIHAMRVNTPSWGVDYPEVKAPSGNPVHLSRDESGVAHIRAKTRADAMFALGFVEAQDRLFQLETLRLVGRGTFSKVVGTSGLSADKLMRTLRVKEAADQMYNALSAADKALCDAFADGINAYLANEWARPAEFLIMGAMLRFHEPERFVGADCALFLRLLQYQMSTSTFNMEVMRWRQYISYTAGAAMSYADLESFLYNRLSNDNTTTPFSAADLGMTVGDATWLAAMDFEAQTKAREREIYDQAMPAFRTQARDPANTPAPAGSPASRDAAAMQASAETSSSSSSVSSLWTTASRYFSYASLSSHDAGRLIESMLTLPHSASNAWAGRGANGKAVHMSDPHLANTVPAVWYFAHIYIEDEDFHMSGGTPPGVPAILNGRTSNVRFGHTLSITDQGDLFVMQADSSNPATHYVHNGVAKAYTVYEEEITVYGQSAKEKLTVRVAPEYGPDVSAVLKLVTTSTTTTTPLRICAYLEALQDDSVTMPAIFAINTPATKTVADVQAQLAKVQSPNLGSVYSDELGGIGTSITGRHRIRAKGHTGRLPTIGNGTWDYTGTVPAASMPSKIRTDNTTTAFVWAANSRPTPSGFQYHLSFDDYLVERSRLISEHLAAATPAELSSEAFHLGLQHNQSSAFWLYTVSKDLLLTTTTSSPRGSAFDSKLTSAARDRWADMKRWDGVARIGSTETSDLWRWAFLLARSDPILLEQASSWIASDLVVQYVAGFVGNPTPRQRKICGDKLGETAPYTDAHLVCARYAGAVWNSVVADYARAEWATSGGVAGRVYVQHLILHGSIAQGLFTRTMAKGGDPSSPDITKVYTGDSSTNPEGSLFVGANGPSARWIFVSPTSGNDYEAFRFNVPAGNSGNVFSDYYYNLKDDFVAEPAARYRSVRHWTDPSSKAPKGLSQRLG